MTKAPLVSICIPTYARPVELEEAIRSVLAQSYENVEVVVSDNGTLGEAVVQRLQDPRVRYFKNQTNVGLTGNLGFSIQRARGELVGLLMDDDRLLPAFIDRVVAQFNTDPSLDVVFTNHYFDRGGRWQVRDCALPAGRYPSFLRALLQHQPVCLSSTLMRREIWARAHPFPDVWTVDLVICLRLALAGCVFSYLDEPLMVYRIHTGQLSSDDTRFREDNVTLWETFSFADPDCERLRRTFLARSLLFLAATQIKHRHYAQAKATAQRARRLGARNLPLRQRLLALIVRSEVLARLSGGLWSAMHPARRAVSM